jgi:hypothetical protein
MSKRGATEMSNARSASRPTVDSASKERRVAYRRLAAAILGLDVESLTDHLRAQRTGAALCDTPEHRICRCGRC